GRRADLPRVLFWAGGFAPVGGIESFLHDAILGLRDQGVDTRLACWGPESRLLRSLNGAGVPVSRLGWRWGCRWNAPDWALLATHGAAVEEADVVVFGKLMPVGVHRRLVSAGRPRFVLVTPYRPAEMWSAGALPGDVLQSLDAIVVQAASFAEDLRALSYAGRIERIPYVPPECLAPAPLPHGPLRVGFLGRLAPQKNLGYLLEAMRILNDSQDVTLDLFGDGAEREPLLAIASRLGLASRVRFHGAISPERVPDAVDSCHVFAFSSISEGQCLAALEVLSRGRAVAATPVGAFPEMLADSRLGTVCPLNSAAALAAGIRALGQRALNTPGSVDAIQQAYRETYGRGTVISRYAALFGELAGIPGPRTAQRPVAV
ncbi:MAG TPA: glycosyltransferase, partial [Bryobacteraceae bacterium]|nr:glycosyltransferase [Bryobacteraceae bacterium]